MVYPELFWKTMAGAVESNIELPMHTILSALIVTEDTPLNKNTGHTALIVVKAASTFPFSSVIVFLVN